MVIGELEERVRSRSTPSWQRQQVDVRVVTGGEVSEPMLDELDDEDAAAGVARATAAGSWSSRARGRSAITSS